ncbi:MAG: ATP synthase subunit I [Candidatus Polarisedimenticolaceae bacterium]|nr:ATP synthase subunit I [Candidatus Polarisedimenticolaceae bacterium]
MLIADKQQTRITVRAQLALTLATTVILMFFGMVISYSALMGGLIATVANAFFAKRVFVNYRAQNPGMLLAQIYSAEIAKLILVGVLFAVAIAWIEPLSAGALFSAFIVVYLIPSTIALIGH